MNPLWLVLHLPCLPLEANAPLRSPSAVVAQNRILVCDAAARQAGVGEGMGIAAARMLAPEIGLLPRDPLREAATLESLACWAGSFTPRVSLVEDALLLEIGACLRLFGGAPKLAGSARAGVAAQGFAVASSAAATPLGALWLARRGDEALCCDLASLHAHLDALPVSVLPESAAAALKRFGARTLADARRLPSAALGRRIGSEAMQLMAQAYGELPDPRPEFAFPEQFALALELPAAVEHAEALLFAARRLISALSGWLHARQAGVREIVLQLKHRENATGLVLQFADVTADAARFERLLREKLERLTLAAPVEALRLEAKQVVAQPARNRALFDDAHASHDAIGGLLERLRARLGDEQVYRLAADDDHRPECATAHVPLFGKLPANNAAALPRPLWLLDAPEALAEIDGRPYRHGPLALLAGPERIESGWWDGGEGKGDLRRDYFVALSSEANWLWIYRECRAPGGWFLHGVFA